MSFHSILLVLIFTIPSGIEASHCNDVKYNTIDDPRRSTAYSNFSSAKLCDRSIIRDNVWYRFSSEAGGEMPTTKPPFKTCGTYVPIWLHGSHPTIKEGVVRRKACANVPGKPPFGCGFSYDIQVRNCSGFYIYKLKKPLHCYLAYCAGSKIPNCKDAAPEDYCLENRPPYISMPDRYYALNDSKFQLAFTAFDPEGYPMRYSYLSNLTVKSVSIDQTRKLVNISVKETGSVSLKVVDYGGLEYIHTVEIVTVPCNCQNAGKCHNRNIAATTMDDLLVLSCVCPKPYTGKFCEVHPCDKKPCFRGVSCSIEDDGYKCGKCPNNFEGDGKYCQLVTDDTANVAGAEMTIVSGLKWDNDLLNKSSRLYKDQTVTVESLLTEAYISTNAGSNVFITGYRKGSVVVEFQVVLKKKMDDPLQPLRRFAVQNDFRIFKVDPQSVKQEKLTEVEGTVNMVSGLEWKDNLLNKSSTYFKIASSKIANEINKIYTLENDFVYVFVTGFRKRNFVVEFKLFWRNKVNDPLEKLKQETKDGKLGKVEIDKGSVKEKKATMSSADSSYFGLHKAEFILLMFIVSIVVLVCFIVCGICIRKKHNKIMLSSHTDHYEFFSENSSEVLHL